MKGTEVKALKNQGASFNDSFAKIIKNEIFLFNMHISPYKYGNIYNEDPVRTRKLLLHKKEINKLVGKMKEKGLTIVPIRVYTKKNRIKLEFGIGRGKKKYDKKEDKNKRDIERDVKRTLKRNI